MEAWFEQWKTQTTIAQGWHIPGYEVREHTNGGLYVCGEFFDGSQGQWRWEVMDISEFMQLSTGAAGLEDLYEHDEMV